jgi:D-arginine dehydrogenase
VRLRVTRRHLLVTRPSDAVDRRWPVLWQLGNDAFYARPESGGLLLCGCDLTDADPDDFGRDEAVRELIARKTARYLPGLEDLGVGQFWCGLRTLTADGRFVIGPDPEVEGLHWAAGLAGAGMVCAAEVGRLSASSIMGDAVGEPEAAERAALSPARPMVLGIGGPTAAEA